MNVLSIDLASQRYKDFGIAFLEAGSDQVLVPKLGELGLSDPPDPGSLAEALNRYCQQHSVTCLLLDGPQGWRYPGSPIEHMRLCERVFNTPGKTGAPGHAKPATYLTYIQFSIDVFEALRISHGWSLLTEDWPAAPGRRLVVETYPSAAWSLLGLKRLPSRAKRAQIDQAADELARVTGPKLPGKLSHDELQAAVALPVGQAIVEEDPHAIILAGVDPIIEDEFVYEGLIAAPRVPPA